MGLTLLLCLVHQVAVSFGLNLLHLLLLIGWPRVLTPVAITVSHPHEVRGLRSSPVRSRFDYHYVVSLANFDLLG